MSEQEERIAERIMIASVSLRRHNANVRKEERQLTVERERKEEESLIFWVTRPIRHVGLTLYEAEYVDVIRRVV